MTLFSNLPGDEGLSGHERARVLAAVMTTTLMGVFDGTMINIALPSMASAMQVPANVAVWFANGYLLQKAIRRCSEGRLTICYPMPCAIRRKEKR